MRKPAEVAGLRRRPGIGDGPRDVLPRHAALQLGEGALRVPEGRPALLGRDLAGDPVGGRLDLDHPDVPLLGGGREVEHLGVDVGVRDLDAVLGGELRLERDVDQPLERDAADLLAALGDDLELPLRVVGRDPAERQERHASRRST